MCILGLGSCSCFQKLRPSLSPAPSETGPKLAERGGTALLVSVAKITLKAGSVYYLNLVQLSEAIISVLVAHAPPSTHLQQLQGGPQICIVPRHAMPCHVCQLQLSLLSSWSLLSWSLLPPHQRSGDPHHPSLPQPEECGCVSHAPRYLTQFPVNLGKDCVSH